ncbi:MAG: hypothetical protein PHY11_04085 [Bacilli bacterium]|nr:hypothetical protein [Bacilli bacterium]MDD4066152.1 hypothetical protein [Bacilli bacterium]
MFDWLLVEGMVILVIVTTIIRNIYSTPKHQIPFTTACVAATVLSYFLVIKNFLGYFDFFEKYLGLSTIYEKLGPAFLRDGMQGFYVFLMIAITAIVLFIIFYILVRLAFVPSLKKYQQDPEYTLAFAPWMSIAFGIIKAAIFVVLYLVALDLFLPATSMTLSSSWLFKVFTENDVIAKAIMDFATANVGVPF